MSTPSTDDGKQPRKRGGKPRQRSAKAKGLNGSHAPNGHGKESWEVHADKLRAGHRVKEEPKQATGWLVSANDVKEMNVEWVWDDRLAKGALHLIAGHAGTGKSTIAFDWAAAISSGGKFPDGTVAPMGKVAIWSGEDSYESAIKPRMRLAGANFDNVFFLSGAPHANGRATPFNPSEHMAMLAQELAQIEGLALVIVDPIVSATKGDSHKNSEVRQSLQPLVDLLAATNAVGIGITHLTKGTSGRAFGERVTGSLAFNAIARMVFGTTSVRDAPGKYRLIVGKTNIAPTGGGFEYGIEKIEMEVEGVGVIRNTRIKWGDALTGDGTALMDEAEGPKGGRPAKRNVACALLEALLANGPRKVSDIAAAGEKADISLDTLRRAAKVMGAKFERSDPGNNRSEWQWSL